MFSSQFTQSPSPSPGFFRLRSYSPRPRIGDSSDPRLSSTRPLHPRQFADPFRSLTEQKESKRRPLFSYSYKLTTLQLLCCYIFTKIGGRVFFELPSSSEKASLPRHFFTSILRLSSHGTNAPLARLHRCRGEEQAKIMSGCETACIDLEVQRSSWGHHNTWGNTHKLSDFVGLDASLATAKDSA